MKVLAALCAIGGMRALQGGWPGPGVAVVTLAVLVAARGARAADAAGSGGGVEALPRERAVLIALTILAGVMRLVRIASVPPVGINADEDRYAWFALETLRGRRVWPDVDSTEPMSVWVEAFVFWLVGPSVKAARVASAMAGTMTIPLLWWALRPAYGPAIAVIASAGLAASRWHVLMSRLAQPYVFVPLVVCLVAGLLVRASRSGGGLRWFLAGAATGLSPYAYLSTRAIPIVGWGSAAIAWMRRPGPAWIRRMAVFAAGACCVAWPLAAHYVSVPDSFTARMTFLLSDIRGRPLPAGLGNFSAGVSALVHRGEGLWSSSYPLPSTAPALGPIECGLAILGCVSGFVGRGSGLAGFWGLLGLSTLAAGTLGGIGFPGGVHRLGTLLPLLVVCQACGLAHLVGTRGRAARLAVLLAVLAGLSRSGGFVRGPGRAEAGAAGHDRVFLASRDLAGQLARAAAGRTVYVLTLTSGDRQALVPQALLAAATLGMGVRVASKEPPGFAWVKGRGGVVALAIFPRSVGDLVRECFPRSRLLTARRSSDSLEGAGLALLEPEPGSGRDLDDLRSISFGVAQARWLAAKGRIREAEGVLTGLEVRWPGVGAIPAAHADVLLAGKGDPAIVEVLARRAARRSGNRNTTALNILGYLCATRNDLAAAGRLWGESLAMDPLQPVIVANLRHLRP